MERFLHSLRAYPALAGITTFVLISVTLAVLLGTLMHRSGASLKPLVFFFGFLAIVAVPQGTVHLLDVLAHRRAVRLHAEQPPPSDTGSPSQPASPAQPAPGLKPVSWDLIFGPGADPSLITDAKRGLDAIVGAATEAKLSFNRSGESALAARFNTPLEALQALDRYGTFFQFAQASGSDDWGWTARRHGGQGEWNHLVAAGNELYAWSGATREGVEARRIQALGPIPAATAASGATATAATAATAASGASPAGTSPGRQSVSHRLVANTPVMACFVGINLVFAVGWFFKGSAWATRQSPPSNTPALDAQSLRERLLAINHGETPVTVRTADDGRAIEITWRYADARWLDLMRVHRVRRTHKLVLLPDESSRTVRVREFWSAFDASAGLDGLRLHWEAATGMQFFQFEHRRVFGAQLDADGRPTGELSAAYTFNLQELKGPVADVVTAAGWTWQPVLWNAPAGFRWLTE
ncbi:MAG: hypothetical protein KF833_10535 [Verrucomicrobiae bacterium]|nr:hypothetical protein [Verrucomicrobiae bacterium]